MVLRHVPPIGALTALTEDVIAKRLANIRGDAPRIGNTEIKLKSVTMRAAP